MSEPLAYTIPDAVKASGASRTALYDALRRGELSARKHGKRTLIEAEALKGWLARMPAYQPSQAA
jgi:excisionase family DNA binding protein